VIGVVIGLDIDIETKSKVLLALNKVPWIQNNPFAWHYIDAGEPNGA
jgi:hypothetical protein